MEPKDFDVATDALPEDVKKLFRNCRLIGRRFRLAHVFFGRETIEVATFRAASAPEQGEEPLSDVDPEDGENPELDSPQDIEAALEASLGETADAEDEEEEGDDEIDDDAEADEAQIAPDSDAPIPAQSTATLSDSSDMGTEAGSQSATAARSTEAAATRSEPASPYERPENPSRRERRRDRFDEDADTERLL